MVDTEMKKALSAAENAVRETEKSAEGKSDSAEKETEKVTEKAIDTALEAVSLAERSVTEWNRRVWGTKDKEVTL